MKKNISLIITKDNSPLLINLLHFKVLEFNIIPSNASFLQFHILNKNCSPYESLNDVYDRIIKETYSNTNSESSIFLHNNPDFQDLLIMELVFKLNLQNFALFHNSRINGNEYCYFCEFENRVYNFYGEEGIENDYEELFKNKDFNKLL